MTSEDVANLDKMLATLRKYDVSAYRNKLGDNFTEIILVPMVDEVGDKDEEDMEDKDVSMYHNTTIGITRRGFDDDDEEARLVESHKRVIRG